MWVLQNREGGGGWHKALVVGSVSLWRRHRLTEGGGGGVRLESKKYSVSIADKLLARSAFQKVSLKNFAQETKKRTGVLLK